MAVLFVVKLKAGWCNYEKSNDRNNGKELQRLLEKERRNEPGLEGFYPEEYIVVPGKALKAGSVLLDAGLEKAQPSGII
jgi:hypothetical protein